MSHDERLRRTLFTLGIFCAVVYLGTFLWQISQVFSDLILLLSMAWLIAYVLQPIAQWLDRQRVPQAVQSRVHRRWGATWAERVGAFHIPYNLAAVMLYLLLLFSLVLTTVLLVPGIVNQLLSLANQMPGYIQEIPEWWEGIQAKIVQRFDVDPETLAQVIPIEDFVQEATASLPRIVQNAVQVVQRVASGVANTLLVLILSLYIMLDGKRLSDQFYSLLPIRYKDESQFVFSTINRTFGGFLRGQLLMALIQGVFTGIAMQIFGLQYKMITSILSGLVMFIPELGAPLAMLLPASVSLIQGSQATIPLLITLFVFQQILLRLIIPQIMSEAIGMPPLLVLVSVLISTKVIGFWGFFFGIPVAGAIYIITVFALEQIKHAIDQRDQNRQQKIQAQQPDHTATPVEAEAG